MSFSTTDQPKLLKLTAKELTQLLSDGRRFKENFREAAKLLFVAGMDEISVANKLGLTRGRIYQIRDKVYALYLENNQYPSNWERVSLVVSPELAREFNDRAAAELRKWREGNAISA